MKCEKPEFTPLMRARLNKLYSLLKEGYQSKQYLCNLFGIGERQIRQMIEVISHRFPVISTSGTNAGYKIATSVEDLDEAIHTWREIDSRQEELDKRKQPLIRFVESHKERV